MNRKHIVTGFALFAAILAAAPAFAADGPAYAGNPGEKLARGVVNTTTGWLEVPKQTVIGGQEAGIPGLIGGLFKGVALGATRTVVGGLEIATFWAPVPDRYEPIMKPATVFDGR